MPDGLKLPPGATLVSAGDSGMKLPPGATLVSSGDQPAAAPVKPWYQLDAQDLRNAGIGFLKGAGQTAYTVVHGASMGLDPMLNIAEARYFPNLQQSLAPQGTSQKVGAGVEQAGEMMLTGGPLREGATALAGKVAPGAIARFAAPAARIAAEAANAGGNAMVHNENPLPAAAAGGAGGAVGEALPLAVNPLKKAAVTQYNKFLNPTTKVTKAMAEKVTPELIDRGVIATSGDALEKQAGAKVDELGQQINGAVANVPASVKPNTQNVINDLEKYKQGFIVNGTPIDETAVKNVEALQQTVQQLGPDVSYQSLNKVRQILDAKPAKAGAFAGKVLADGTDLDVQKEGANAIRRELASQSPDIAKINAEFHFWKQVEDVVGATNERRVGQQGGLIKPLFMAAGAAGGFAHGGSAESAGLALTMYIAHQAVTSAGWRTSSAVLKNQLADAIMSGSVRKATDVLTRLGASAAAVSQQPAQ